MNKMKTLFITLLCMGAGTLSAQTADSTQTSRLSLKPWGIALKFLFLHHENILFPND